MSTRDAIEMAFSAGALLGIALMTLISLMINRQDWEILIFPELQRICTGLSFKAATCFFEAIPSNF